MNDLQNLIEALISLRNKCDKVTMPAMTGSEFDAYFAKVYGSLNDFYDKSFHVSPTMPDYKYVAAAQNIIDVACQLLEVAADYFAISGQYASEVSVDIYEKAVDVALRILQKDFYVNAKTYAEAEHLSKFVKARKACGIWEPGSGYVRGDFSNPDAMEYASKSLASFSQWISAQERAGKFDRDPLFDGPNASAHMLFSRFTSLKAKSIRISG